MGLNGVVAEVKGEGDHTALIGRLQSSTVNRNWDSIEELWNIKEKVKRPGGAVSEAFQQATAGDVIKASNRPRRVGRSSPRTSRATPPNSATSRCSPTSSRSAPGGRSPEPIIEAIRGYLESDYDYPAEIAAVAKDLEAAKAEVMDGVPEGEDRDKLTQALDLSLRMNPLTPDHHFYIDQGTNARVRIVLIAIGKKLVDDGKLGDPEDVMYLRYNELRTLMAGTNGFDAEDLVGDRRDERETAYELRPRDWVGTATEENARLPLPLAVGVPGEGLPEAVHHRGRDPWPRRLRRCRRGHRPGRSLAGTVRPGRARRDRGLPDDQSRLGGALHQDLRAGHRRRRHGVAPRRRLA